uniref:RNase H type-1 domain-containing protein n=1 Tax=Amphiprion percula TaxID=161767 RepID=A0A3P8SD79_AMPPE
MTSHAQGKERRDRVLKPCKAAEEVRGIKAKKKTGKSAEEREEEANASKVRRGRLASTPGESSQAQSTPWEEHSYTQGRPASKPMIAWKAETTPGSVVQRGTAYWGFILKQGDKERYRQKGRTEGSAQAGEVTAVLEGLLEMEKRKVKRARIITDSSYCAQALNEDLAIWEENGFETAKGKTVAHRDLWKKIAELRMNMDLEVMHQKAHTKEGDHWKGNDEVDRFSAGSRPHCP